MPLTWAQLKPDLDPKRFTVRSVPALLRKTKGLGDYCDGIRALADAIRRLGRGAEQLRNGSHHGSGAQTDRRTDNDRPG